MIRYHGGPITPINVARAVWQSKHAMISFAYPRQLEDAAEVAQSFVLDNGAFTTWKRGKRFKFYAYLRWIEFWSKHPGFDWCLIPDVIDGNEDENDELIDMWKFDSRRSVPVWHLHESIKRLKRLCRQFPRVAFGSSGQYHKPGARIWWERMEEALPLVVDPNGYPICAFHGLRMMDPAIFSFVPFKSVDSVSVALNHPIDKAWGGPYAPRSKQMRACVLADRFENHACAIRWSGGPYSTNYRNEEIVG